MEGLFTKSCPWVPALQRIIRALFAETHYAPGVFEQHVGPQIMSRLTFLANEYFSKYPTRVEVTSGSGTPILQVDDLVTKLTLSQTMKDDPVLAWSQPT